MQTTLTLKTLLPYIVIGILIVIASFFMKGCEHKPDVVLTPTNQLNEIIADKEAIIETTIENNKTLRLRLDSLTKIKSKVVHHYHTIYDSLIVADTACMSSLITLYNECEANDSINEYIISNQQNQINNYVSNTNQLQDIIAIQKYQLSVDSVNEVALKQAAKKEFKRGRKQGVIIGCAIESAVIIGGLLLVK